jgi:PAS domain S-box-containing protein
MPGGIAELIGEEEGLEPPVFDSTESVKLWLSQRFAEAVEPARILRTVCTAIGEHLELARVCYGEMGADYTSYTIEHDWTRAGVPSIAGTHKLDPTAWIAGQYQLGRTLTIDDVRASSLTAQDAARLESNGIRAFIGVPLVNAGKLVALFRATDDRPRAWRPEEISLVAQTGARLWASLEHLRLTEKLRESEEQFRLLAENLPGLCWVSDPDGTIRWGNAQWHEMFDGTGGETGAPSDVLHPDDLPAAVALWEAMRNGADRSEVLLRLRGRDGVYRPFLSKAAPVRDPGGAVVRWCGVQIDLTEKEAIDRRQAILRHFHDRTRDLTDPEEILSVLSSTMTAHFGINHLMYCEAPEGNADRLSTFHARDGARVHMAGIEALRAAFKYLAANNAWEGSRVVDDNQAIDRDPNDPAAKIAAALGVRSGINVPIVKEGRLVAALTLLHGAPRHWTREDVDLCEELAERVWATVSRARAETEVRERERNQAFLIAWGDAIRGLASADAIVAITLERLARHLGVTRVTNAETSDGGRHFLVTGEWRDASVGSILGNYFSIESVGASVDREWAAGELICYEEVRHDPRLEEAAKQVYIANDIESFVSVPLVQDGQMRSALSVQHNAPRRWREREITLIREIAERTWVALDRVRALNALQDRERSQKFLIEWSDRLRGEASPEAVLSETLERLGKYLGTSRANFAECEAASGRFQVLWEWRAQGPAHSKPEDRQGVSDGIHADHLAGRIVIVEDVLHDARFSDEARARYIHVDARAFLAIPLVSADEVRAVLSVQQATPRIWQEADIQLLRDVAERTWTILELARAERALQAREQVQSFLIKWSDSIRNESNPHTILSSTLDQLGELLDVSRVNYAEMNDAGDALTVLQERHQGTGNLFGQIFPVSAIGAKVMAEHFIGRALRVDDILNDSRFDETRELYTSVGVGAVLTIPMVRAGKLVAVLSAQNITPRHWTDTEVEVMREVADRTLTVLERAASEERLAESEAQLAAFMEHAPVVMYLKDAAGRYIRINPEFARAMNRPIEQLTDRSAKELFEPQVAERLEAIGRRALAGEVTSAEVDVGLGERYDAIYTMAFPIPGNGRARTAGFALDLTERRRAEAALARSREALYQSEKISALGSLLAGVSHELNNPLSIVVAQAVMMERQAKGSELAERAQKIRKAADRCARIVQTFLAMARQKRPERAAVDLNAVALAAHELAAYGLKTDGIVTEHLLAPGLPLIAADSDQLHQVIINLIVNAQQAMVDSGLGEKVLTLRTALGADRRTVVLEVADTGPGVPQEARRRIFEPFYTTKPQGQGTGVGLSFSQGLVEAHGGRLELAPSAQGACFRLTLPISEDLTLGTAGGSELPTTPAQARRALVVDDEEEIAESLADFLSLEGFTCEVAVGGAAAQARLTANDFDLIVSDLRMPDIDGPQLHAWIASQRPELLDRVAFATGDTLGIAAERFLREANRPVLEKPFMPEAVHRFLEQMDLA